MTIRDVGTNNPAHAAVAFIRLQIDAARVAQRRRSRGTLVGAGVLVRIRIRGAEWIRIGALRVACAAVIRRGRRYFATVGRIFIAIGKTRGAHEDAHPFFARHAGGIDVGKIGTVFSTRPAIRFVGLDIRANAITRIRCRSVARIAAARTRGPTLTGRAAFSHSAGARHSGGPTRRRRSGCRSRASRIAAGGNEQTRHRQKPTFRPNFL